MGDASLIVEVDDSAAIIRFNRPSQRNSLSISTLLELGKTLDDLVRRPDIHSIVFTGAGKVFASGADISELVRLDEAAAHEFSQLGQQTFQKIADAKQLTIAAINGYCMGGGLDLALACDIRVASRDAVLSHPGAKRGIITGWGGTQRLPRLVGRQNALDLFLTARLVNSEEALQMGLVSRICDPDSVLTCALQLASLADRSADIPHNFAH
ncbi:MAG TPA: enoyl-CoA hydratase/isomerase family protein [Pyrinomonadaceae bacterium]|nr:enoyl-CoA hydratase/isomerase family protein [Pyrinomonadaceae bacterium]